MSSVIPRLGRSRQRGAAIALTALALVLPAAAIAQEPAFDRTAPPPLPPLEELQLPPVVTRSLPNGLRLLIVRHDELPLATFHLVIGTGSEADPADRAGLGTLAAAMLQDGTTTREALEIADQAAYLGVQLSSSAGWDLSSAYLHTPTAQLDSALALFADVVLRPTFPERDLERRRRERTTQLIQMRDRPPQVADMAYASILFGDAHPYGRSLIGTQETTEAITRADIERFHSTYYRPNNATLIVVGAVTADDIERRAGELFGGWERGTIPPVSYGEPAPSTETRIYLVDHPGATQSSMRIGMVGVPRATEDYFPLVVMNTLLGGSFTSRLMQNLRETRGYTYGASSFFAMRRQAGPFTARAEVTGTKTDSSLIEFMNELRAIRDTVPAAELERTKQYLTLQLPAAFETTQQIANQLVPIVVYDLPLDYHDTYARRIQAVRQSDVQRVAQRYLDPSRLAIVIVGDRQSIEPGLRALGFGEVTLRDPTGQVIVP